MSNSIKLAELAQIEVSQSPALFEPGTEHFRLYTDGGLQHDRAASACLLVENITRRKYKLVASLNTPKSSEAEIFAVLLGLFVVKALTSSQQSESVNILWHTDSLGTISAVNKVKFTISEFVFGKKNDTGSLVQFKLHAKHVAANTRFPQHTACDKACNWVIKSGSKLITRHNDGYLKSLQTKTSGVPWFFMDLSAYPFLLDENFTSSDLQQEMKNRLSAYTLNVRGS